jgi:membrane protease YdiL (CAAX protease family)
MSRAKGSRVQRAPNTAVVSERGTIPSASTSRELWYEVFAVLSVGVLPYVGSAVVRILQPSASNTTNALPYWLGALSSTWQSTCVSFIVLYLIFRSGSSWETFGIKRPRFTDVPLGLLLFLVPELLWRLLSRIPTTEIGHADSQYSSPQVAGDYFLMLTRIAANSFAEELVVRAYLVTRLQLLLRSQIAAVVVSAVLFASYHMHYSVRDILSPFIGGLVYGLVYLGVRRIWPFVLGHLLYNVECDLLRSLS